MVCEFRGAYAASEGAGQTIFHSRDIVFGEVVQVHMPRGVAGGGRGAVLGERKRKGVRKRKRKRKKERKKEI